MVFGSSERLIHIGMTDKRLGNASAEAASAPQRANQTDDLVGPALLSASCVRDASGGFGASAAFLDPPGNQLGIGASLDQQVRGLPLPWLIRGSFEEADRKTRSLGEQVGAPGSYLGDVCQGFSFFGPGQGAPSRVSCRGAGDARFQDPLGVTLSHPAMIEHTFELESPLLSVRTFLTSSRARRARRTRRRLALDQAPRDAALAPVRRSFRPAAGRA